MSTFRDRMTQDLVMGGYAAGTREHYLGAASRFVRRFMRSPEQMGQEQMQTVGQLVTFNGKTFDYPYIQQRAILHRVAFNGALPHLDLLHESRRRWKELLPNCRLQTLEVDAEGDRWNPQWPAFGVSWHDAVAYCEWRSARDGMEYRLPTEQEVINLLDLVTMGELVLYMLEGETREPEG